MGHHPLADCDNCPLFNSDAEFMGSSEPKFKPELIVVGGMPNVQERFMGGFSKTNGGKLLNTVFKHYGQSPTYYYTTAVLCRTNKKIPAKAVACCRPRLIEEISLSGGSPVVTFGNEAALSVLGRAGVASLRVGPPKRSEWIINDVIPTINPYACMRQESQFPNLVLDIGKLFNKIDPFKEPEYSVIDDHEDAFEWLYSAVLNYAGKNPDVTIDIECKIDKEESFGHPDRHLMLCVGLMINDDNPVVLTDNALTYEVWGKLLELLRNSHITAQNGKFDLNGIRPLLGKLQLSFDTMLAHYCLDERGGIHSLDYLGMEFLGAPNWKEITKKYIGPERDFSKVPRKILYKYNAYDVYVTRQLKKLFSKMLEDQKLTELHNFLIKASQLIMDLEYDGITIDKDYLDKLVEEFDFKILTHEHYLSVMAYEVNPKGYERGDGINPNSWKQVKAFFADLGIILASTDADSMEEVIAYKDKFPKKDTLVRNFATKLLDYRKDKKLNGTYIQGVKDRLYKNRINSSYLLHGTTTGRLSSRNPNLQNIPRDSPIKKMYVPSRPDNVFINVDYSQAELRVLSWLAQDTYFRDIFNDGTIDPFNQLIPVLYPGAVKDATSESDWKEMRTMVKTFVYGLSYGRTEFGIAAGFNMDVKLAKQYKDRFFAVIPDIISWQYWVRQQVKNTEDLVTPFGRHRRYSLITDENIKDVMNEALAFLPQSTASDICLTAAINFNEWLEQNCGYENHPYIFNLVHDAVMVECHESDAEMVTTTLSNFMLESGDKIVDGYVKFAVDYSIGHSWAELK